MQIWAHRGASADFPENTLPAFQGAVDQGSDGVELDVMRCASGELVVCHDESLERLARVPWLVANTAWWKLRRANVGAYREVDARIPLLNEVLDLVPASLTVNVELKCDTLDDRGLSQAVAQRLLERGDGDRILVSSFNPLCLLRFAAHAPSIRRGWLIDPERSFFRQVHLWLPLLAPQANLMASVAKGIFGGELPWNMIYAGMGIGAAIIVLDEILKARGAKFRVPVLACAVGIYLPVDLAVPIFFGGLLAHMVERKFGKNLDESKREKLHQKGTLFSAGLITGEALTGIAIAVPIFVSSRSDVLALPESMQLGNTAGGLLGVAMIVVVAWWMYRMATRQKLDS